METFFRNVIRLALLVAILVIVVGSAQRMSAVGLGCPDGLGCVDGGGASVPSVLHALAAQMGAVHRILGGLTGILVLLAGLLAFLTPEARSARVPLLLALGIVAAQGVIGIEMSSWSAIPWVMVAHLLMGFLVVLLLQRARLASPSVSRPSKSLGLWLNVARLSEAVLLFAVFIGGWVAATGAGLACPDFPTCHGSYLPEADYVAVIKALLIPTTDPRVLLAPGALAAIQMLHRAVGGVLLLLLMMLGFGVTSNPKAPILSRSGLTLNALVFLLVVSAFVLVERHLPVALGALHVIAGIGLLLVLERIRSGLAAQGEVRSQAGTDESSRAAAMPQPVEKTVAPTRGRLRTQLGKTRGGLMGLLQGRGAIDSGFMEDLEAQLLMADLGVSATEEIMQHLADNLDRKALSDVSTVRSYLRQHLRDLILPVDQPLVIPEAIRPFVILVVGVNGVGKTTTIGKLAKRIQQQGHSVMLAAGDTFRAAAVEQLQTWGERNGVPVIAQHTGADSASVIYDALEAAKARNVDVLIADTAGRLHNKSNLMEELSKVKRIMAKLDPSAPHEVLLVLDGGTGQNAVNQARQFHEAVGLTGLALTKLDGTAKGGVLFALARQFGIPIRFIGIGEGIDDLRDFDAEEFIAAIFDED